jgi:hypothetical protein
LKPAPTAKTLDDIDSSAHLEVPQDDGTARTLPEISEHYRDYAPSIDVKKVVEELVKSVPPRYLAGLKKIVLTNRSSLSRDQRRQKIWQRGRNHQLATSLGAYYRATRSQPASVWLFVDNIQQPFPSWFLRMPMLGYSIVGSVLYHEIGHHIHRVHKPVYEGKENVAEDWSRKLGRAFFRKRYWYLVPVFPVLGAVAKAIETITSKRLPTSKGRVAT